MVRIACGDLRERVDIKSRVTTTGTGQPATGYGTFIAENVPARVVSKAGAEGLRGDEISATATVDVWMRYNSLVTPKMAIIFGTRTLHIIRAYPINGRDNFMICECREDV